MIKNGWVGASRFFIVIFFGFDIMMHNKSHEKYIENY